MHGCMQEEQRHTYRRVGFWCEGRPAWVIAMDHVYLRYEQESEEFCLMAEDDQLYADHIDENSTVLVTADGKILPL